MQLKIQINVPQDQKSPTVEQPAPLDPVKIRNFLLLLVTLLSLIGYGVYSMWTNEDKPVLPDTVNTLPNNANSPSNNASNNIKPQQQQSKNTETLANTTLTENTSVNEAINPTNTKADDQTVNQTINKVDGAINTNESQNNIASNKSPAPAQITSSTNATLETDASDKTLAAIDSVSNDSPVIANTSDSLAPETNNIELENTPEVATQNATNITPTTVNNANNIKQKTADLLTPNNATSKVVKRVQLTSNIKSREPTDTIEHLNLQAQTKLYLFTEIHGKSNQKIIHRWIFNENIMAEVVHNIGSNQWRTYSSKNFDETMVGEWTVHVVDEDDNVLKTIPFDVSM